MSDVASWQCKILTNQVCRQHSVKWAASTSDAVGPAPSIHASATITQIAIVQDPADGMH